VRIKNRLFGKIPYNPQQLRCKVFKEENLAKKSGTLDEKLFPLSWRSVSFSSCKREGCNTPARLQFDKPKTRRLGSFVDRTAHNLLSAMERSIPSRWSTLSLVRFSTSVLISGFWSVTGSSDPNG
jgi:hypothetical protein